MKTIENIGCQGDVLFRRVARIPSDAKRSVRKGPIVVAHSETQHHHQIDDTGVVRYETSDPLVCYLAIEGTHADVVHCRPWDTHETIRLPGGGSVFEVRRQREYAPEGWRRIED